MILIAAASLLQATPALSIAMLPAPEAHQFWLFQSGDSASSLARGFVPPAWSIIHTAKDSLDKVDGASMARMHRFAMPLVRRLSASVP